jgi:glycosyltransferase involved in cell wall biosynthesis
MYAADSADLLEHFGERLSLYHCVDDYTAITRYVNYRRVAKYSPLKCEEALVRGVDLVVATAPRLFTRWSTLNAHTLFLPNVADTTLFASALQPGKEHPALANIPDPRVAFIGALDAYKVDFALLEGLVALCPEVQFVCAGPVGTADGTHRRALPQASNLHYLGTLPQAKLPTVLRSCSAGLIPYALNDYTSGVSPLKLYEYLAAGLPTVSSPLPALRNEQARGLFIADPTPADFAARLRDAMAVGDEERWAISHSAAAHSWESRVAELEALILARLADPSVAVTSLDPRGDSPIAQDERRLLR